MRVGWTCVIVDDEAPARQRLRSLLRAHPVEVVAEAADVAGAVEACRRHRPDILFLDIELRRGSGLGVLPLLEVQPKVVFVSAHDCYGVQAYDVGAEDYLLKPVNPARLGVAMARVMTREDDVPGADEVFLVSEGRRSVVVPWFQITHVEAEENYTRVHLMGRGAILVRRTLMEWEGRLPQGRFARVHRSLLIRIELVSGVRSEGRDEHEVELAGGTVVRLGRVSGLRLRQALRERAADGQGGCG